MAVAILTYVCIVPWSGIAGQDYYWWRLSPPPTHYDRRGSSVVALFFFLFCIPLYIILVECPPGLSQWGCPPRIRHLHTFSDTVGAQIPGEKRHPCMRTNRASPSPGSTSAPVLAPQVYSRGNLAIQPMSIRDTASHLRTGGNKNYERPHL